MIDAVVSIVFGIGCNSGIKGDLPVQFINSISIVIIPTHSNISLSVNKSCFIINWF